MNEPSAGGGLRFATPTLVALGAMSEAEVWRQPQPHGTNWSAPTVAEVDGKTVVVVVSGTRASGFDLCTGEEL